jgi:MFS family permease
VASLGSLLGGVVAETLLQRIVPDEIRGRTLGIIETLGVLAYASGSFLLPALAPSLGLDKVLILAGGVTIVAAAVAIPLLGDAATHAPKVDPVRGVLAEFATFRVLPPGRLETAQRRASVVSMTAGQPIIRQGQDADRFYVIASGEVEVTQDTGDGIAPRVLRHMGPKEGFGEIGLLSGVPRTATVTAVTDGQLVALDKDEFLSLVGSSKGLTFPFLDAHRGGAAGS